MTRKVKPIQQDSARESVNVDVTDIPAQIEQDSCDEDVLGNTFAKDAQNGLSHEQMLYNYNMHHPLLTETVEEDGKAKTVYKKYPVCKGTSTGFISCKAKNRKSDLDVYGTGVVIFFQFMKVMFCIYFICFLYSLPAMVFFYSSNPIGSFSGLFDINNIIERFSLGNVAQIRNGCGTSDGEQTATYIKSSFELECPTGTLSNIRFFGQRLKDQDNLSCDRLSGFGIQQDDFNFYPFKCAYGRFSDKSQRQLNNKFRDECQGQKSCTYTIGDISRHTNWQIKDRCVNEVDDYNPSDYEWIMVAKCQQGTQEEANAHANMIVMFDLFMVWTIWIILLVIEPLMKITDTEVEDKVITASDFTVCVKIPKTDKDPFVLTGMYKDWVSGVLNAKEIDTKSSDCFGILKRFKKDNQTEPINEADKNSYNYKEIVNVNVALSSYSYLKVLQEIGKQFDLRKKQQFYLKEAKKEDKKAKIEKKIQKIEDKIEKLWEEKEKIVSKTSVRSIYAFIQFRSMEGHDSFVEAMDVSICRRCWTKTFFCCYGQENKENEPKYFMNNWPDIEVDVVDPSLIQWENLGLNKCQRCCKSCWIYLLSILFMMVGFAIIMNAISYKQHLKQTTWNKSLCDGPLTDTEVEDAYHSGDQTSVDCYCYQQISKGKNMENFDIDGDLVCQGFTAYFVLQSSIVQGVALLIAIINECLVFIIKRMANKQGKHSLTQKLASIIDKLWFIQFLNSSMLITLISAKAPMMELPPWIPIFNGQFEDFTQGWFDDVGVILAISCGINCALMFKNVSKIVISMCKRFYDQGFSCDPKKTRMRIQADYEAVQTGSIWQIEVVYSRMIALTFCIMVYGAVIPTLYIFGMIMCVVTYWTEKYLFLRHYREPPKYRLEMAMKTRKLIEQALIVHVLITAYMFTTPYVFSQPDVEDFIGQNYDEGNEIYLYPSVVYGGILSGLVGSSYTRFISTPAILYMNGVGWFIFMVFMERWFGIFRKCLNLKCCCLRKHMTLDKEVSKDMYDDLQPDALKIEYEETKKTQALYFMKMNSGEYAKDQEGFEAIRSYNAFLEEKRQSVKKALAKAGCQEAQQDEEKAPQIGMGETGEAFNKLIKDVHFNTGRINSLHSYEIYQNPDFKKSKNAEARFYKYKQTNQSAQAPVSVSQSGHQFEMSQIGSTNR